MEYCYEAFTAAGVVQVGKIEAENEQNAAELLRGKGFYVQKIEVSGSIPMKTVLPPQTGREFELDAPLVDALKTVRETLGEAEAIKQQADTQIMPKSNWQSELEHDLAMIEEVVGFCETLEFFKKGPGSKGRTDAKELATKELIAKAIFRGVKNRALS